MQKQTDLILQHLLQGLPLTRISADHLYRVASLPRRISDLREQGHNIVSRTKWDATGRRYAEYMLVKRDRNGKKVA